MLFLMLIIWWTILQQYFRCYKDALISTLVSQSNEHAFLSGKVLQERLGIREKWNCVCDLDVSLLKEMYFLCI